MTCEIDRNEGNVVGILLAPRDRRNRKARYDVVVVIFHHHGSTYMGKMFNDEWLKEKVFLEE